MQHHDVIVDTRTGMTRRTTAWLWLTMGADGALAFWMHQVGGWLDHTSRLTAMVTFGGHHVIVMLLAVLGFAILAAVAVVTAGFRMMSPRHETLTAVGCIVSVALLVCTLSILAMALIARMIRLL